MKGLGIITRRGLILSLCLLIVCAFCITPVSAATEDGSQDPAQEGILNIPGTADKAAAEGNAFGGSKAVEDFIRIMGDGDDPDPANPTDPFVPLDPIIVDDCQILGTVFGVFRFYR